MGDRKKLLDAVSVIVDSLQKSHEANTELTVENSRLAQRIEDIENDYSRMMQNQVTLQAKNLQITETTTNLVRWLLRYDKDGYVLHKWIDDRDECKECGLPQNMASTSIQWVVESSGVNVEVDEDED